MAMDTDLRHKSGRQRLFFIALICFIWVIIALFVLFQFSREKTFRAELLDSSLQQLNSAFAEALHNGSQPETFFTDNSSRLEGLRLTLIRNDGTVLYDSATGDKTEQMSNHLTRNEVESALHNGHAYTVRRQSESTSEWYFYSATAVDSLVIRSALPYSVTLRKTLRTGHSFLWFIIAITLLISTAGTYVLRRMRLTEAAFDAEHQRALFQEQEKIRIKKQLTNNINHELKTPVSAIKGCLETLIANPTLEKEAHDSFLQKSYSQTVRLENLLHDVATITRLDEAPDVIHKAPLSLNKLIENVVSELRSTTSDLPIRINCSLPADDELIIEGNELLLRSIFRNLIDNAIAYSGGRDIFINYLGTYASGEQHYLKFLFSDNGIGVEEEHLPHIFERFYRVDKGRSRKMGGTGLGLSIVKNALMIHGGCIEAHNRAEGGLEFTFTLRK